MNKAPSQKSCDGSAVVNITRISNLDCWDGLSGASGSWDTVTLSGDKSGSYWNYNFFPTTYQVDSSSGTGKRWKWVGYEDKWKMVYWNESDPDGSMRVSGTGFTEVNGVNVRNQATCTLDFDNYNQFRQDLDDSVTQMGAYCNSEKVGDTPPDLNTMWFQTGAMVALLNCLKSHVKSGTTMKVGYINFTCAAELAGSLAVEKKYRSDKYLYIWNTNVEDDTGYGLGCNVKVGGKKYITSYYKNINVLRNVNITNQTYQDHSGGAYKNNNASYNDEPSGNINIPDELSWATKEDGTAVQPDAKVNSNYIKYTNFLTIEKHDAIDWSRAQWGITPTANVVVFDDSLIIELGPAKTISKQTWDRNGYYEGSSGPTQTTGNKVVLNAISLNINKLKSYDSAKIDNYYSQGLSSFGYGDVKIGGGCPIANNRLEATGIKTEMRFSVYNADGVKQTTGHNLHWMISNKQFISGNFDPSAAIKLEGDSTGDVTITTPAFNTTSNTTLWLNVYAETDGNYVKVDGINVE